MFNNWSIPRRRLLGLMGALSVGALAGVGAILVRRSNTLTIKDSYMVSVSGSTSAAETYQAIEWHSNGTLIIEDGGELTLAERALL